MKKMCYTYSRQKYPFPVDEKPGKDRIMRNNKRKRKTQNKKRPTARSEDFIMKPSVDWCFKELMRNPKTRKGFIAVLLQVKPEEIDETILLENELPKEAEEEKQGILDVHVCLADGVQIDIEMQVFYVEYWDERLLFYLSKMYAGQIKAGESYRILKKCIQVSVLNFERFPDDDFCYRTVHFWDEMAGKKYTDKLEIQILELPKLQKKASGPEDVMEWMRFFRGQNKEELKEVAKGNEYLEGAYEDLVKMSLDEKKRLQYEAREKAILDYRSNMEGAEKRGFQRGVRRGITQGIERGVTQGEESTLIRLYRKNRLTLEEAAEEAKMTVEEFRKLAELEEHSME